LAPFILPSVAAKDSSDKLPLHLAVENNASAEMIVLLLKAYPEAGVHTIRFILQIIKPIPIL
jgi:ankyrin repeat protein